MDLKSTYLGFELNNPIIVGACPLGTKVDSIRPWSLSDTMGLSRRIT